MLDAIGATGRAVAAGCCFILGRVGCSGSMAGLVTDLGAGAGGAIMILPELDCILSFFLFVVACVRRGCVLLVGAGR